MEKKLDGRIWPGLGAGVSLLFSAFSIAIGIVAGYLATRWYIKKYFDTGKVQSIHFSLLGRRIHLHHWIMGTMAMALIPVVGSFRGCPDILIGLIGGIIADDFNDFYYPVRTWIKAKTKI